MKVTEATRVALWSAIQLARESNTRILITTTCGPVRCEDELQRLYDSIEPDDIERDPANDERRKDR